MNPEELISKYYANQPDLHKLLLLHSHQVADKALDICNKHPELSVDRNFLWEGAMLHDIGIFQTDAPGILCYGTKPYILHGVIGAEILRKEGLPRHARIAERHTGTGLTLEQIERQNLPLPHQDFSPETMEEKIVCFADKFFSKSSPYHEKSVEKIIRSMERFGPECTERFREWLNLFG